MLDAVLSLIAPHMCLQCQAEGSLWCGVCRSAAPTPAERCYRCHALSPDDRTCKRCRSNSPLYSVQAATRYEGYAKQLVWKLKFVRAKAAAVTLAEIMADRITPAVNSVIVPVPTSSGRVRQRGYDQAVLVARHFACQTGCEYVPALVRLGQQQQRTATRAQRLSQLAQAYTVPRPELVAGKPVVLIDDVITTGATLEAAARALKASGARRVSAIVFAQA